MLLVAIVMLWALDAGKLGQDHFLAVVSRDRKLLFVEPRILIDFSFEHHFFSMLSFSTAAEQRFFVKLSRRRILIYRKLDWHCLSCIMLLLVHAVKKDEHLFLQVFQISHVHLSLDGLRLHRSHDWNLIVSRVRKSALQLVRVCRLGELATTFNSASCFRISDMVWMARLALLEAPPVA